MAALRVRTSRDQRGGQVQKRRQRPTLGASAEEYLLRLFIVGAGASAASPARLPVFVVLRAFLLRRLSIPESSVQSARELAPERFMQAVAEGGLPLSAWLTATLSQGSPNATHHVLRAAIAGGDVVWTLNVDELIEGAGDTSLNVAVLGDVIPSTRARLFKPHGTVSRGRYIFRTDQVVRPLPEPWAHRLRTDSEGADVVVVGYAGADLDMLAVLDEIFHSAGSVTWFALESARQQITERFPGLPATTSFLGGSTVGSLTPAFLSWADAAGLTSDLSATLRAEAGRDVELRPPAVLDGDARLAAALILERAGDREAARRAFARLLWPRDWRQTLTAARRLHSLELYGQAPWTRPLLALAAGPAAPVLPGSVRRRLDRVHVTLLSSHMGDHKGVEQRASSVVNPDDPAILVALAKAARYHGDFEHGLALAMRAEAQAREAEAIDILAHTLFEQGFILTWSGRLAEARQVAERLHGAVGALAGIRWVAWGAWQLACLDLYRGDGDQDAARHLDRAETLFAADKTPTGLSSTLIVRLTATRKAGDFDTYRSTLDRLARIVAGSGWTDYTTCAWEIERAEYTRVHLRRLAEAHAMYERVLRLSRDEPIHRGQALLGLAEIARTAGQDPGPRFRSLAETLAKHPVGYLRAHLAVAEFLAGETDPTTALQTIRTGAPQLPTRDSRPARSPLDYCLGPDPQVHETFLP